MPKTKSVADEFTEMELNTLLEIARSALQDADVFDDMASRLDINDAEMLALRAKVEAVMRR